MTNIILRRPKLGRATKHVVEVSETLDAVVRNDKRIPAQLNIVFRWGTTSNIDCHMIVNTAEAIHRVNDKSGFRSTLSAHEAERLCPKTFFEQDQNLNNQLLMGPLVVRPQRHAQGRNLYVVNEVDDLAAAIRRCGQGWYASELIDKVAEYRVMFAQGRVVWVAQKTPGNPDEVAWNVARGGRFDNVRFDNWPLKAIRISREAFLLSRLDFGAVDVMVDRQNNAYVLEINSAPSQTSPYRQSCTAKVFDYIVRNGKAQIPIMENRGDWKKFVHPAIAEQAIMVA